MVPSHPFWQSRTLQRRTAARNRGSAGGWDVRLSTGQVQSGDAGENEVDPGEELLAVVVLAHLVRDGSGERVVVGVELFPRRRYGVEELGAVHIGPENAGVRGVLAGGAEDVVHQHRGRGEL